LIRTDIKKYY